MLKNMNQLHTIVPWNRRVPNAMTSGVQQTWYNMSGTDKFSASFHDNECMGERGSTKYRRLAEGLAIHETSSKQFF